MLENEILIDKNNYLKLESFKIQGIYSSCSVFLFLNKLFFNCKTAPKSF